MVIPSFDTINIKVDQKSNTFFVPDSLLLSQKEREWKLKIPYIINKSRWSYAYLVEWNDAHISYDSTIINSRILYIPEPTNHFSVTELPVVSAFDFQNLNQLPEVTINQEGKSIKRSLRKTNCETYEDMMYEFYASLKIENGYNSFFKGRTYNWGHASQNEGRIIMYLGCGQYRDINYIKNITIPEEFQVPDYEAYPTTELNMRSTVYWNPNIFTDANGTATFSFFTSDVAGEFEIVAQGLAESTLRPLMGTAAFDVTMKQ